MQSQLRGRRPMSHRIPRHLVSCNGISQLEATDLSILIWQISMYEPCEALAKSKQKPKRCHQYCRHKYRQGHETESTVSAAIFKK